MSSTLVESVARAPRRPMSAVRETVCVNVGCGATPTLGWRNFDNSPAVRLAGYPRLAGLLHRLGVLDEHQFAFSRLAREQGVEYGDAVRGLPLRAGSVDAIYASHVVEHLDRDEARRFITEARRVLRTGGVLRLAVPDVRVLVTNYLEDGDADHFISRTMLASASPGSLRERVRLLVVGQRHHRWMYDGKSLAALVSACGFRDVRVLESGVTTIEQPGELNLREREEESVYVEGVK